MTSKTIVNLARVSKLFQPLPSGISDTTKTEIFNSKSYKLMINYGIIKSASTGMYSFLPLGMRVLNKLINIVDKEMANLGAEKIMLPALTFTKLWKKTKRYDSNKNELFTLTDRHGKEYVLSPVSNYDPRFSKAQILVYYIIAVITEVKIKTERTSKRSSEIHITYEEAICDLVSTRNISDKLLPLRLYQISNKWRDEMKPRLGFLRSREFVMKDLYTFDTTLDNAQNTYDSVCESYDNIFKQIGIDHIKVIGDVGTIGGLLSHEYHYMSDIGEDTILRCLSCNYVINETISKATTCPECKDELHQHNSAEIGHTFLLDTKYSQPLKAMYTENNKLKPMVMGCFGLGLSRIFALVVEILSTNDEMRWPMKLAPYTACIIPPKTGSKEEHSSAYVEQLFEILHKRNIDTILDDRTQFTIGKRFIYARAMGYPYVIVIGKAATQSTPLFEVHDLNNSVCRELSLEQINHYFDNVNL